MVLLVPLAGLTFFGTTNALEARRAQATTAELRQNAELVELLSSTSVLLDLELDSIHGLQEAASFGVDVEALGTLMGFEAATALDDYNSRIAGLLDAIKAQDSESWADPDAVALLVVGRERFEQGLETLAFDDPEFELVLVEMQLAISRAHQAETDRLAALFGRLEFGRDLIVLGDLLGPSRKLTTAAQFERKTLGHYLLPLEDGETSVTYRDFVAAAARFELILTDLKESLPPAHLDELERIEQSRAWQSYQTLRDAALAEEVVPDPEVTNPLSLLPIGIPTFVDGFDRSQLLLDFDRRISSDFTNETQILESEATRQLNVVGLTGLLLALATVTASYVTIRSITKPMRELLDRARRITDGDLATVGPVRGPPDIGLVHSTLDEMSANLRTLWAQAEALSAGRLDDHVLSETVVGPLGASVHGSVARLRSMTSRLEHEATHDSLTGLPNRAAVLSLLDRCLSGEEASRTPLAAIMLDLNGFKQANDNMGHPVGDELLTHVAGRLRSQCPQDFVARLGGDEFMVVVVGEDEADLSRVDSVAQNALSAIKAPFSVSFGRVELTASAGIVTTNGPTWLSPAEVLRRVDLAMYEAKEDAAGAVVHFDQRLHDSLLERATIEGELRKALSNEELDLHFQPIVELGGDGKVGLEALIRWHSPVRGLVSPSLFIPVAEQSELITQVDTWVIDRAVEVLGSFGEGTAWSGASVSINVSARHLSSIDLVGKVAAALERHGAEASRCLIEVTESQLIPNMARAEHTLRGLKELGVKLAIDDFGTGYASVAHLRRVHFDRVKIDQSFLAHLDDETDRSLAALLVSLGTDLELEVVAEGVENEQQLQWAMDAGCTHVQGYLLARPAPLIDLPTRSELTVVTGRSVPLG